MEIRVGAKVPHDQIQPPRAEHVAKHAGHMVAGRRFQGVPDELARRRLLQQNNGIELLLLPLGKGLGGQEANRDNVLLAVAFQIAGNNLVDTVHRCQRMMDPGKLALSWVLQPLRPMIRFQQIRLIHRIAVGIQHVRFAVAVQVHHL